MHSNEEFEIYFEKVFLERWPALHKALVQDEKQIAFSGFENSLLEILNHVSNFLVKNRDDHPENYILDPASLIPVFALELQNDSLVLDLCAAPGGKSLAILAHLGGDGRLVANDSSKDRVIRLKKVLNEYSAKDQLGIFKIFLSDGRTFFKRSKNKFDRILVDTPCSSERHLLKNGNLLKKWSLKQSQGLAIKQYTLLCTALLCAESNAKVVYSTCSINPIENDEVIKKILKKKSDQCELDLPDLSQLNLKIEKTEFGFCILPDRTDFGPIYLSRLKIKK